MLNLLSGSDLAAGVVKVCRNILHQVLGEPVDFGVPTMMAVYQDGDKLYLISPTQFNDTQAMEYFIDPSFGDETMILKHPINDSLTPCVQLKPVSKETAARRLQDNYCLVPLHKTAPPRWVSDSNSTAPKSIKRSGLSPAQRQAARAEQARAELARIEGEASGAEKAKDRPTEVHPEPVHH